MEVKDAIKYSTHNKKQLEESEVAGCYYCCEIFKPDEIKEFVDREENTAICPKCGVDSVLGDKSGYDINVPNLEMLRKYWFEDKNN